MEPLRAAAASPSASAAPVGAFVSLEIAHAHNLLKTVDESLAGIGRVVRGTELLVVATKAEGDALIRGEVQQQTT